MKIFASKGPGGAKAFDIDELLERLKTHGNLKPSELFFSGKRIVKRWEFKRLMDEFRDALNKDHSLLRLDPPINVVADIHGQYLDLIRWFRLCKWPPDANYVFLGDYVDRGPQGAETMCLLAALKIKFPKNIWLLRGNHETANVNKAYGFFDEVSVKYDDKGLWSKIQQAFATMPVAAVIGQKVFCLHGGLSPDLINIEQIDDMSLPRISPDHGLLCDMVWSDPDGTAKGWTESARGISFTFGKDVVKQFCKTNNIAMIIRGHQLPALTGYQFFCGSRLLTIFSAPYYCRGSMNDGVLVDIDKNMTCMFKKLRPSPNLLFTYDRLPQRAK